MGGKRTKDESSGKDRAAKKAHVTDKNTETAASPIPVKKTSPIPVKKPSPIPVKKPSPIPVKKTDVLQKFPKTVGNASTVAGDEEDFPRGGASALTPAEIREVRLAAESEFGEETKKRSKSKKGPRGYSGAGTIGIDASGLGDGIVGKLPTSAEILRHRSLSVGMKIWGALVEVNHGDLIVSLPGGLRGFVKIEEASDVLADMVKEGNKMKKQLRKLERKKPDDAGRAEMDATKENEDPCLVETGLSLKEFFSVGQLVSCTVSSLEHQRAKGDKLRESKRIGLSLRLSFLHQGLTIDVLHEGQPITACVSSVEDHGYLLSFGVLGISGFLLQQNSEDKVKFRRGQLLQGVVLSVDKKRGTVSLKTGQNVVAGSMVQDHEGLNMELLLPGCSVNARVRTVLRNGLLLSFLTYFTGTVDIFHLDVPLLASNWCQNYTENQRLKAKVLYVDPHTKLVGLTLNTDLVHNKAPSLKVDIGETFGTAIVRRVDRTLGLLVELPSKSGSTAGYVHISNASDEHIEKLEKKFSEGKIVQARVTGFRMMDGLATVSLKKTVLEQLFFSHADVKPGMVLHGSIVAVEPFGLIVQVGEGLKGLCPLQHLSEYQRAAPSAKFQVGGRFKFRVLSVDPHSKKITLSHKKTLVSSKLTPITSYEDAVEGLVTHGWITSIMDYGCFVGFYNDVKGLAHRTELGIAPGLKAETAFQLGQCIKCRVLRANPSSQRLSISFVTSSTRTEEDKEVDHEINPGSIVSGAIILVKDTSVILDVLLPKGVIKGVIEHSQLSDNLGHIEQLKTILKPGYKFDRLVVLEKDSKKLILSAKFSLLQGAESLPSDISQLHSKAVYQGFIGNVTEKGCFVRFLSRLTGLAQISEVADAFVSDPFQLFTVGQSVRAQVLEVKEELGRFYVSLKQSACFSTDATLLQGYFIEEEKLAKLSTKSLGDLKTELLDELIIGSFVDGEIQDIKDYGVIVNLYKHKDVVGFLTHYQLGDPVEVGKMVKARVLDVVKADGIADLTLRPELFPPQEPVSAKGGKNAPKKRTFTESLTVEVNATVTAVVELVKDEYLVLSLPEHGNVIGFACAHDYNLRVLDTHQLYQPGQRLSATVKNLPDSSTGGRMLLLVNKPSENARVSTTKKARKNFKCNVGSTVEGEIVSVNPLSITLAVGQNIKGSIHITEVWDEIQGGHPFSNYVVGQTLKAKVLAKKKSPRNQAGSGDFHLELSTRPSELADEAATDSGKLRGPSSFEDVTVGQLVTGYVQDVNDEKAWLLIAPHLRGRLFVLDSSNVLSDLQQFKDRFKIGHAVRCHVSGKDIHLRTVDLSLRDFVDDTNNQTSSSNGQLIDGGHAEGPIAGVQAGMVLGGRVAKIYPGIGGLSVQIGGNIFGRVHVTQFSDKWEDYPERHFQVGQFVRCVVLELGASSDGKPRVDLTLRPSLGGCGGESSESSEQIGGNMAAKVETLQDLSLGLRVQGYVKSVSQKGCFVTLSRYMDARVLLSDLSESFLADPQQSFPPGKLVTGRITSLEPLSGRIEMSLKTSASNVNTQSKSGLHNEGRLEDLNIGDILNGQIRRIESFGVFVTLEKSNIVGLCHVSEVSDNFMTDIQQHFKVGQNVQVKVLKVDMENKRISLGLKESYFGNGNQIKVDDWNHDAEDGPLIVSEPDPEDNIQNVVSSKFSDQDNDDLQVLMANKYQASSKTAEEVPPLEVDFGIEENVPEDKEDGRGDDEDAEIKDDERSVKEKQRAKKRLKKEREAEIRAAEEKRLQQNQAPETVDEFEQLVHASPNSSFVWIKYMAFMLSMADVDKAREIAERALQTINFREEGEKINVWVAYLNLENAYGNPKKEAVLKIFQKALQYCDPKKIYLALLGIYERTEKHEMADELLKTMTRKFKTSSKVWLRNIQNLLKRGMETASQKLFEQSLLSLPRHKHIKVITQAAIMEFKIGSPERARAIFEGVVRNYPRRTDLWSVYLDQEIRLGDPTLVRSLFERVLSLELPPKKIKFLFKKYLNFEKANGKEERVEYVKTKAMEYVEAKLK